MKDHNPTYYAIIPANVRYDKSLPMGAKMMFGEITALSNAKGYCFATNGYFAELYGVTKQGISKWIKQLEAAGYVRVEYVENEGNQQRRVSILVEGGQPQLRGGSTPVDHNNTSNNNSLSESETQDVKVVPKASRADGNKKTKSRDGDFEKYLGKVQLHYPLLYGSNSRVLLREQHKVVTAYLETLPSEQKNEMTGLVWKIHELMNGNENTRSTYKTVSMMMDKRLPEYGYPTIEEMAAKISQPA